MEGLYQKSADRRESLQGLAGRQTEPANLIQTLLGRDSNTTANADTEGVHNSSNPASAPSIASSSKSIPEELRPIIQQHGEVWPQQTLDWEVQWEHGQGSPDDDEPSLWTTNLSLTTPRLGEVNARLQLTKDGVRIALLTPYGASAADLRDAAPVLEQSLAAAGLPLLGFLVKHDDQGQ
jgi:hypothetical protein